MTSVDPATAPITRLEFDHAVRDIHAELNDLRASMATSQRRRRSRVRLDGDALEDEMASLHANLSAYGPMPEHRLRTAYRPEVLTEALSRRLIFRAPLATERTLTATPPSVASLEALAEALTEGPKPLFMLREQFDKNLLADLVERAAHAGYIRKGVIVTGRAGRPKTIVARADQPLPMYWDTFKVEWR